MEYKTNLFIFTLIIFIGVNQISIWGLQTQTQNYNQYVIDNTEDYYIVKSVNSEKICNEIRQNNMDFTS